MGKGDDDDVVNPYQVGGGEVRMEDVANPYQMGRWRAGICLGASPLTPRFPFLTLSSFSLLPACLPAAAAVAESAVPP